MVLVAGSSATLIRTVAAALGILCVCWLNLATAQQAYYIHTDHLDTPRTITNGPGQTVWTWSNDDPFGYNAPNENPTGLGNFTCNLRFPGQYFDRETNLHYNYFRDYDPWIGRYVQSDPIGLRGGINTYAYVNANPLRFQDPKGQAAIAIGPALAIGGIACYLTPGCKQLLEDAAKACGKALDQLVFNRPKNPPDVGPPGGWIEGPRRGRKYGPDGQPEYDIDKPHQGNEQDHVHEWPGGVREEPGRAVSPVPKK